MEPPKHAPDPGDSRIVGIGLTLATRTSRTHGPQLEDFERLSVSAHSRLPVKYGPAVLQFDGKREERKKNGERHQRGGPRGDVQAAFKSGVDLGDLAAHWQRHHP